MAPLLTHLGSQRCLRHERARVYSFPSHLGVFLPLLWVVLLGWVLVYTPPMYVYSSSENSPLLITFGCFHGSRAAFEWAPVDGSYISTSSDKGDEFDRGCGLTPWYVLTHIFSGEWGEFSCCGCKLGECVCGWGILTPLNPNLTPSLNFFDSCDPPMRVQNVCKKFMRCKARSID